MKKALSALLFLFFIGAVQAQKVESISFNLYTDSLKKGFYNYISVDGKFTDGRWLPLDTNDVIFTANTGVFKGNDIYIDSTYGGETITVKAVLRANPAIWKEATIYIRKRGFDEPLKTNEEVLDDIRSNGKSRKKKHFVSWL